MDLKRKIEEEDEWEREGHSSNPLPPNPYAVHVDILNNQHNHLSDISEELKLKLIDLQDTLQSLEQEELNIINETADSRQEYEICLQETISLLTRSANSMDILFNYCQSYLDMDQKLSSKLNDILRDWHTFTGDLVIDSHDNNEVAALEEIFEVTEFKYIGVITQIKGYEERMQILADEMDKINTTNLELAALSSTTEQNKTKMKKITDKLDEIEQLDVIPVLKRLAKLRIVDPMYEFYHVKDQLMLKDMLEDMEKIKLVHDKQRTIQQFLSFRLDEESYYKTLEHKMIDKILTLFEDEIHYKDSHRLDIITHDLSRNDEDIATIKRLIQEMCKDNISSSLPLVDQIRAIQIKDREIGQKWEDDWESILTITKELGGLHLKLSSLLYEYSNHKEDISHIPTLNTDLRNELDKELKDICKSVAEIETVSDR
ncbi:hypothetical protein BDB01DRAFT_792136 [Pilobolus umbonatus]|nr:hypothetical protein BDB01DRAFT_792136 [Pilobolus umbonatus]